MHPIWQKFGREVVIFDGPTGTMLNTATPELLVTRAAGRRTLTALYRAYEQAGAQVITTDTFAANAVKLGGAARVAELNRRAVEVARAAVGPEVAIAASVGPLDLLGTVEAGALEAVYAGQIAALSAAQPDFLLLETFASAREARAAIDAAQASGLPFLFSLNANRFTTRAARQAAMNLAAYAAEHGARGLGVNCAAPFLITELVEQLLGGNALPLVVYPNAGAPAVNRGSVRYNLATETLLHEADHWIAAGVAALGGCCGIVPEQIAALCERFRGRPLTPPRAAPTTVTATPPPERPANALRDGVTTGTKRIAIELRFPADADYQATLQAAAAWSERPEVFFTVPDCPTGNPGCDPLAAAALLRQATAGRGEVVLHQAASNANLSKLYANIFGAWELGVRGILAVSGDPPALGPFNRLSHRVTDLGDAAEMLNLLRLLNDGRLLNDQPLRRALPFWRGCAYGPGHHPAAAAQWLRRKVAAGAESVFTQPIFTVAQLDRLTGETGFLPECGARLFVGILPIGSLKSAQRLQSGMIPGVGVPPEVMARLAQSAEAQQADLGMELATELAHEVLRRGHGIYFIPPFVKDKFRRTTAWLATLPAGAADKNAGF